MPTQRGYAPPNMGQAVGSALGGMADALMKISSMQSDRVDRAYTLARQNRLDDQALRRIDLDTQRLTNEAARNEYNLNEQRIAEGRYEDEQLEEAANTWYGYRTEGVGIKVDELSGAPMTTEEDIIQLINQGKPIGHLTTFNPELSQAYRTDVATDEATVASRRERQRTDLEAGLHPTTQMPLTPAQSANVAGEDYSETLATSFARTPEGRQERFSQEARYAQSMAGAEERADVDPNATLTPQDRVQLGDVFVRNPDDGTERWIRGSSLVGARFLERNLEIIWGKDHMDQGIPPPPGAEPIG